MMPIAIDASVIVALLNPTDVWKAQAHALRTALERSHTETYFFDCALVEAISVVARRLHEKGRAAEVTSMLNSVDDLVSRDRITWVLPDVPRLYSAALDLIRSSSGELNFNDALIALACRERRIGWIASFDPDFDRLPWLKRVSSPTELPPA